MKMAQKLYTTLKRLRPVLHSGNIVGATGDKSNAYPIDTLRLQANYSICGISDSRRVVHRRGRRPRVAAVVSEPHFTYVTLRVLFL